MKMVMRSKPCSKIHIHILSTMYNFAMYGIVVADIASLTTLDIAWNSIGDNGMSLMSTELQYSNVLKELRMAKCELSAKSM